jgi:hypothetical protein
MRDNRSEHPDPTRHSVGRHHAAIIAALAVVVGCGGDGGGGTGPTQGNPIPEQSYLARQTNPTNDCGGSNLEPFDMLAVIQHTGEQYAIAGLFDQPVSAQLSGDHLTTSVPVPVDSFVVTFGTDWTFVADRETFTGPTTFKVALHDRVLCTFTLSSAGTHVAEQDRSAPGDAPDTATSSAPSAATTAPRARSLAGAGRPQFATAYNPGGAAGPGALSTRTILCAQGTVAVPGAQAKAVTGLFNGFGAPWQQVAADTWLYKWDGSSTFAYTGRSNRSGWVGVAAPSAYETVFGYASDPATNVDVDGVTFSSLEPGYYTVVSRYYWFPPEHVSDILIGQVDIYYNQTRDYESLTDATGEGWCQVS